jgi:leader peptidase (prepilin peptidase)/N-methyltransferase
MSIIPVVAAWPFGFVMTTGTATAIGLSWISVAAGLDRLWRQLPDALVLLALLPTAMAAAVLTLQGSTTAFTGIGFGAVAWGIPMLFVHLIAPAGLGFGDVKAAGVVGATLGLTQPAAVVACGLVFAVAAAAAAAMMRTSRRGDLALGPHLALGALSCLAVAVISGEVS